MFKCVNSAVKPRLEVIFAKRGTCESREQCTGTTQRNTEADSYTNPLLLELYQQFLHSSKLYYYICCPLLAISRKIEST